MGWGRSAPVVVEPEGLYAPPLWFILWGVFFHTLQAYFTFRFTTSVGTGAVALRVRVAFALAAECAVFQHIYAWVDMLGISLEVQNSIFLGGLSVVLLALPCMFRTFYMEFSRTRATALTALHVFVLTGLPALLIAPFGLPPDPPGDKLVLDFPAYLKANGLPATTRNFVVEFGIMLTYLYTYLQLAGDKPHKA
jgi:hypothetical protein